MQWLDHWYFVMEHHHDSHSQHHPQRSTLTYDSTCDFCVVTVNSWKHLTGSKVEYDPTLSHSSRHISLTTQDGRVLHGAEAVFTILNYNSALKLPLWMYNHVPGFKQVSKAVYGLISKVRHSALSPITRLLSGAPIVESKYDKTHVIFLRLLGLVYLGAFSSIMMQAVGLYGEKGMLPLADFFTFVSTQLGVDKYLQAPTLFWFSTSNMFVMATAGLGAILAIVLVGGFFHPLLLLALFVLHLTHVVAGQVFMAFQWDSLLLEIGFLAIFFARYSRIAHALYTFLLFRLMFSSGLMKILLGDQSWRDMSALKYHFWTQPLPTPLAYYFAKLPDVILKGMTLGMFVTELIVPFFFFMPRRARTIAAYLTITLQLMLMLTGNYGFFNLLVIALCILLLDDKHLSKLPKISVRTIWQPKTPSKLTKSAYSVVFATLFCLALLRMAVQFIRPIGNNEFFVITSNIVGSFQVVNPYALFATMTKNRPQLIFEHSQDNKNWTEYTYRHQPDKLTEAPTITGLHMPRFDWQLWFNALQARQIVTLKGYQPVPQVVNPFTVQIARRLLDNEKSVLALFANRPEKKPRYVRAVLYDYTFSNSSEKSDGKWWSRKRLNVYLPPVTLDEVPTSTQPAPQQTATPSAVTQ